MKVKEFLDDISHFGDEKQIELLGAAINRGLFDSRDSSVMLASDKEAMQKEIATLKKVISEYQVTFNAISPIDDYIPLYTALSDKGVLSQHKPVKDAFDMIQSAGFKVCDWSEVVRISKLGN